ncbi:hypothetical protein [Methylobacter sp.]|uniref:hypothetical protein n=1 Tax=Methylobacter sp. TaxID=2051955 RepID=UPI003DA234E2
MTSTGNPSITPLRQRMIDDMRMRNCPPKLRPVISGLLSDSPASWADHRIPPAPKIYAVIS